jgi:hypothetical protein
MAVSLVPIRIDPSSHLSQQTARQMFDPHPRQDQKPGVVGHTPEMLLPIL